MIAAGLGVGFLVVTGLVVYLMRKFFQDHHGKSRKRNSNERARARRILQRSWRHRLQGVIQKLRGTGKGTGTAAPH